LLTPILVAAAHVTPTATDATDTHSLHDALPISAWNTCTTRSPKSHRTQRPPLFPSRRSSLWPASSSSRSISSDTATTLRSDRPVDRKSTRLNSSHVSISYAVFCLTKRTYDARAC